MSRFKVPTSGWKPGDPMKRATTAGRLSFANRSCPTVAGSTGRGWVVAWPEGTYGDVYDAEPAVFDADGSLLAVEGDELRFGGHGSETYKPTPCESAERVWLVQGAVMHRQSYVFAVRPPEGDDRPDAIAAVVTTSPESALKILRNAHLKVTSKQPIHVTSDLDIFENHQDGTILWQPTGEETWTRLGA